MSEPYGQLGRVLTGLVLLALLTGCLMGAGTRTVDLIEHDYPDQMDVRQDREAYVGERVVIGGFVVDTDPVVVATMASGDGRFTLVDVDDRLLNSDEPLEEDDRINTFGTLEDESTLVVERAVTRERADTGYLFLVSLVGAFVVVVQFVRHWRFDPWAFAFVPRKESRTGRTATGLQQSPNAGRDGGGRRG